MCGSIFVQTWSSPDQAQTHLHIVPKLISMHDVDDGASDRRELVFGHIASTAITLLSAAVAILCM